MEAPVSRENARIVKTVLGREDRGIPTCWLMLDFGGVRQGFGGYDLRYHGIDQIVKILDVVGVECWEALVGTIVRVERGPDERLVGIGHAINDRWYRPGAESA